MLKVLLQSNVVATESSIYGIAHGHLVQVDRKTLVVKRYTLGVFTAGIRTNIQRSGNMLMVFRRNVNPPKVINISSKYINLSCITRSLYVNQEEHKVNYQVK